MSVISFIDATSLKVCHNLPINQRRIFRSSAERNKSSTDCYCGFELHPAVNKMAIFKAFTNCTKKGVKVRKAKWSASIAEANLDAKKVRENYRQRFGIEASYRYAKKVRKAK